MLIPCPIWDTQDGSPADHFLGRSIFFFVIYLENFITLFTSLYYICFIVDFLTKCGDHKTYVTQFFSAFPFPTSDGEMNLPFYLLKSLTKMEKKVQANPKIVDKILFHQGLIKILVMYALSELQVTWKQLLFSLGFEEQVLKTPEITPNNKTKVSKEVGITSRSATKEQEEAFPVARKIRSSKRKLVLQQEKEIKQEPESSVSKQGFKSCDRFYTRRMTRQRTQELQKEKYEPGTEAYDISVEELPMERQKKGKQPASFPYRPKTRPTNKLILKSKDLFKPSLKEDNLIILEDDSP
jgi:hypothetical protein